MDTMAFQITSLTIVYTSVSLGTDQAPRDWPLWGEFAGDLRIPRTKGQ